MILEYSTANSPQSDVITRAYGNVADKVGKPSETGIIAIINEKSNPQVNYFSKMRLYCFPSFQNPFLFLDYRFAHKGKLV